MKRLLVTLLLLTQFVKSQTITETFGSGANQFSIEFVEVGNPGNSSDIRHLPWSVGSVSYIYNLGKYEISRHVIEKANQTSGLNISLDPMTGIENGTSANRPATGISWNEAARFVNWLNISKGYQVAYKFETSSPNDNIVLWSEEESAQGVGGLLNRFRHKNAYYFLPNSDEWHKGAYGSPDGTWFSYPTGTNTIPANVGGGLLSNSAVVMQSWEQGPADINNAGGLSPFGTMGQGGNVWEWNESSFDGTNNSSTENREIRGGGWYDMFTDNLEASIRGYDSPTFENEFNGFRVASVPEPSALSLLAVGLGGLAVMRRRFPVVKSKSLMALAGGLAFWQSGLHAQTLYDEVNPSLSHQLVTIQNSGSASTYKISLNLTTLNDWLVFLNSKATASDSHNLFKSSDFSRTTVNGSYSYSLLDPGAGSTPVRSINLYDAYRYVNWIENGADENADTEVGAYNLIGLDISKGDLAQKAETAKFFIQTSSQWLGALGVITTPNSYYEWTDSTNIYNFPIYATAISSGGSITPHFFADVPGRSLEADGEMSFRIASVPEPSAFSLLAIGLGVVLRRRRRTV